MKWANWFKASLALALCSILLLVLSACNGSHSISAPPPAEAEKPTASEIPKEPQENDMVKIQISVGETFFSASLYDNEATKAFIGQMPLTITMGELNGNEKFYYLPNRLPTKPYSPSKIASGDLMLYGSDCLVLFYEEFSTSYRYTRLGYIDDAAGLAKALGQGSIVVSFSLE